jgi:uncharacterized protein (UPF0297 family)
MGASDCQEPQDQPQVREVVMAVYRAIREKGVHDPVRQIAGYLMSGEPAYITGFKGARALICTVERDRIVEDLVRACFRALEQDGASRDTAHPMIRARGLCVQT